MDPQYICIPLYKEFESLFPTTFSLKVLVYVRELSGTLNKPGLTYKYF